MCQPRDWLNVGKSPFEERGAEHSQDFQIIDQEADEGLISLYALHEKIYPRSVSGLFSNWRWGMVFLPQLEFHGLPWLQWGQPQAALSDLVKYSTDNAMKQHWSQAQTLRHVLRPRALVLRRAGGVDPMTLGGGAGAGAL